MGRRKEVYFSKDMYSYLTGSQSLLVMKMPGAIKTLKTLQPIHMFFLFWGYVVKEEAMAALSQSVAGHRDLTLWPALHCGGT